MLDQNINLNIDITNQVMVNHFLFNLLCELKVKINLVGEYYFFLITGKKTINNEKEDESNEGLKEKFSKREEGPFELEIKVSSNEILLSENKVKNKKKENGIVTLEFSLLSQDD